MGIGDLQFCEKSKEIWEFVGWIFLVFKIAIPVILIILGSLDLGKAVVSQKEDEIKKATTSLAKRAVAGVVIFFVPTLIGIIFGLVSSFRADVEDDYEICKNCIVAPYNC